MKTNALKNEIDILLSRQDFEGISALLQTNTETIRQSNELSYFYYLYSINESSPSGIGNSGIMNGKRTIGEIISAFCDLKRKVQRLAYCDEFDAAEIPLFMKQIGANASELYWIIKTSTPDPDKTLERLKQVSPVQHSSAQEYKPLHNYSQIGLDFIICSNDPKELQETLFYIDRLIVPAGVSINVLSIENAVSMCAGYNEGMQASSAQYKVYLHQDVRILEKSFIPRLLDHFIDNKNVGLIGLVGTKTLPSDGAMWHVDRYGSVLETHVHETSLLSNYSDNRSFQAALCDGFLLSTQYDLPWRADLFDGWDFYDASQCMEFIKRGYDVLIPYQESPWCLHDCGFVSLRDYDRYRSIFLDEYIVHSNRSMITGKDSQ